MRATASNRQPPARHAVPCLQTLPYPITTAFTTYHQQLATTTSQAMPTTNNGLSCKYVYSTLLQPVVHVYSIMLQPVVHVYSTMLQPVCSACLHHYTICILQEMPP